MRRVRNTAFAKSATITLAVLIAVCISSTVAQPAQVIIHGPSYRDDEVRRIEINGLRLGMSKTEVLVTLETRGFQIYVPEQADWDWGYYLEDRTRFGRFRFTDSPDAPALEWFTYHENFTEAERADITTRRTNLVQLVGRPTTWMQWVHESRIADRFVLAANRRMADDVGIVESCYVNWECHQQVDCRPLVRRVNGAVMQGQFGPSGIDVRANDYSNRSRAMLQDERFLRRDFSQAVCILPPIH
jgi:hypothetical protein